MAECGPNQAVGMTCAKQQEWWELLAQQRRWLGAGSEYSGGGLGPLSPCGYKCSLDRMRGCCRSPQWRVHTASGNTDTQGEVGTEECCKLTGRGCGSRSWRVHRSSRSRGTASSNECAD